MSAAEYDYEDDGSGSNSSGGGCCTCLCCCCRGATDADRARARGGGGLARSRDCLLVCLLVALLLIAASVAVACLDFDDYWNLAAATPLTVTTHELRPWVAIELGLFAVGFVCALAVICGLLACARVPRRGLLAAAVVAVAAWALAAGLAAPRLLLPDRTATGPAVATALALAAVVVATAAAATAGCTAVAESKRGAVVPVGGDGAQWAALSDREQLAWDEHAAAQAEAATNALSRNANAKNKTTSGDVSARGAATGSPAPFDGWCELEIALGELATLASEVDARREALEARDGGVDANKDAARAKLYVRLLESLCTHYSYCISQNQLFDLTFVCFSHSS